MQNAEISEKTNTIFYSLKDNYQEEINEAGKILAKGGLVAIPTETVYGLAANALNETAVANIFKAKGRPADNPLIIHISELDQLNSLVKDFPEKAKQLAKRYWPGPLTMIMKKADIVPLICTAGLDTVAIRFPSHKIARDIITAAKVPLAAPSANTSGMPSPTTAQRVIDDMNGKIDAVIDGGECKFGVESTVISMVNDPPVLLRPGAITKEQIESCIGEIGVAKAILHPLEKGAKVLSPGMKYKHYSPKANVVIIEGSSEQFVNYMNEKSSNDVGAICFDDELSKLKVTALSWGSEDDSLNHAHRLFEMLRECDDMNLNEVYAHRPKIDGVGLAVNNRLLRAAGFEVVKL